VGTPPPPRQRKLRRRERVVSLAAGGGAVSSSSSSFNDDEENDENDEGNRLSAAYVSPSRNLRRQKGVPSPSTYRAHVKAHLIEQEITVNVSFQECQQSTTRMSKKDTGGRCGFAARSSKNNAQALHKNNRRSIWRLLILMDCLIGVFGSMGSYKTIYLVLVGPGDVLKGGSY
jgi:hypothetical protein